eukprot:TRINITY_DN3862_c0_g1_i4.p1 TRINITY_DN3862_c0_g1~~TRINITY_DN3862_c0_g1_i4.p1  ORF type:complete len:225 (+),score=43.54 TRINITY_DN3862_c0_g1_i4:65-739(+)
MCIRDSPLKTIEKSRFERKKLKNEYEMIGFKQAKGLNDVGDIHQLWKIETEQPFTGGFLYWDLKIRLRHIGSGAYLAIKVNEQNTYETGLEYDLTPNSIFTIQYPEERTQTKKTEQTTYVHFEDQFRLLHYQSGLWLTLQMTEQRIKGITQHYYELSTAKKVPQESLLKIFQVPENRQWESRFILRTLPVLYNAQYFFEQLHTCLLYTSPSPRDRQKSRMPSSA